MSDPLPRIVGGLYEAFHAVPDLVAGIRHGQSFGYRVGAEGCLDAAAAKKLYDVSLDLRSVRLYHQRADHGLVRLMMWEGAIGDGLGVRPIRGLGTRWTGQKTLNMARLNDHAAAAQSLGEEMCVVPPFFVGFTPPDKQAPFAEALLAQQCTVPAEPFRLCRGVVEALTAPVVEAAVQPVLAGRQFELVAALRRRCGDRCGGSYRGGHRGARLLNHLLDIGIVRGNLRSPLERVQRGLRFLGQDREVGALEVGACRAARNWGQY